MRTFSTTDAQKRFENLRAEVRKGIDDLEAGRVRTFETHADLSAFFEELKDKISAKAKRAGTLGE